jgi:hypothetical protein
VLPGAGSGYDPGGVSFGAPGIVRVPVVTIGGCVASASLGGRRRRRWVGGVGVVGWAAASLGRRRRVLRGVVVAVTVIVAPVFVVIVFSCN